MPGFEQWLRNKLIFLGFTGFTIGVAYAGYQVYKLLRGSPSSQGQLPPKRAAGGGREYGLPKACRCVSCAHVVYNPGVHCPSISCPKCGGKMMRAWDLEE